MSAAAKDPKKTEQWTNVLNNAVAPVALWKGQTQAFAGAENILFEAAISYLARWALKTEKRGFFDLVFVHALAQPLLGASESITGGGYNGIGDPYSKAFMVGARQVPAVLTADYVAGTFKGGFHTPKPSIKEVLLTAGAKMASRPIMKMIYENGPQAHRNMPVRNDAVVGAQRDAFAKNWGSKKTAWRRKKR